MLIVCPSCETSYRVETSCFGEAGRLVRCVRCGDVWLGTESLLVPTIVADHEEAQIDAASAPDCDAESQELSTPESSSKMEGPGEEADAFGEAVAATTEWHGDADGSLEITPEPSELAPQEPAAAPVSFFAGSLPARWDVRPLPAQIEVAPAPSQVYVVRKPKRPSLQKFRRGTPCLLVAVLALLALHSALIGWRRQVVKIAPQTASLYRAIGLPVNLRGLSITGITTLAKLHEGMPVLLVEGTLASTSMRTVKVPRLRLAVRNSAGQELYNWTEEPERRSLSAGESLTFRTRLASPPPEAHDVIVRFFNRDDTAGIRQSAVMRTLRR